MNELVINEYLQKLSNPFLDAINLIFTEMGTEIFFLAVVMVAFWCIDKRLGYRMVNVYLMGMTTATVMKTVFARPRPYTYSSVVSIGEPTADYSFPSGHSLSISNLSTQVGARFPKWQVILTGAVLTGVVMFTRLYLGQHFLTDVLAGTALGVLTALVFGYLFDKLGDKEDKIFIVVAPLCLILGVVLALTKNEVKVLYDVCGGYAGASVAYYLEKRLVKFNPSAKLWQNLIKIAFGGAVVLGVKEGLKAIFKLLGLTHPLIYSSIRYLIVAFVAILLMPYLFKKLKLGKEYSKDGQNKTADEIA